MNQQLLSQSHSSIVKSLQASAEADPFVYGVSESSVNLSKSVVQVDPVRAPSGGTAQDVQFNLPRNGFLSKCILKVDIESDNFPGNDSAKNSWTARCVREVSLRARGVELRKANTNSFIANAIDNENNTVQSHSRKLIGLHAREGGPSATREFQLDIGEVLGFSCNERNRALQNAIDTLFCEDLTVNVSLGALADYFFDIDAPNNQKYLDAQLICQYQQMTSADYDSFKSKNYSSAEPTRRLIRYHEAEQPQHKGSDATTDVKVDIRYKGLVRKINVHWWANAPKAMANVGGQSSTINRIQLYGSGSLLWECDGDVNKLFINPSLVVPSSTSNGMDPGMVDGEANNEFGMQVIDFSNVSANKDKSSFINGCLNTGDLTNVYLVLTRTETPVNGGEGEPQMKDASQVDVDLEVYAMESIEGSSGLVSVSSKE